MFRTLVYSKSEAHSKHCQTPAMENFAKKHTFRPQPSTFFSKTTRSEKNLLSSQNKVFLIFLKMEPCTFRPRPPKFFPKKSLVFLPKKTCSEKVSYTFSKKLQTFWDGSLEKFRNVLILPEIELSYILKNTKNVFRTLTFLEPWHIQNYGIFRTRGIFRTLSSIYDETFCKNSYLVHLLIFREMELSSLSEPEK